MKRPTAWILCALHWLTISTAAFATQPATPDAEPVFQYTLPSGAELNDGRYRDLKYSTGQWYGSTFFTGPDWTRVGRDWHHPGQSTPSVRCFVAPRDGRVTVSGRVFKLHESGDGVRAMIRHNDAEVWRTEIDGADARGATHELELDVRQGDRIRFVVHKRGSIGCDTTGWDPQVTFAADGQPQVASEAFEHHRQGAGSWRYEMEVGESVDTGLPAIYGWSRQGTLERCTLQPRKPLELTDRDVLPLLVIADGQDRNGLAVAAAPGDAWRFSAALDAEGGVRISWYGDRSEVSSADVCSRTFRGTWLKGWTILEQCLGGGDRLAPIREDLATRFPGDALPLDLRAMVQFDWRQQDVIDGTPESFQSAARMQLEQTRHLLDHLRAAHGEEILQTETRQLQALSDSVAASSADSETSSAMWLAVRRLKREIALANPLVPTGPLLVCKRVPPSWSHEVAQYYGWRQRPGGGLYVIDRPGHSLETRDILGDQLPPGSVLEPRLSYDGQRTLFAFVACSDTVPEPASLPVNEDGSLERYFHLYEIKMDGSGLRQLTRGPYDDMMADYLPDGSIVFCSTRRRGYSRCFGPEYSYRWHTYTLHRMNADGSDIRALSWNDVSEWFPAVSNSGHILHARWDYIDRDAVTHQNLWSIRPDGTNPVVVWGNAAPKPHCMFQAKAIPNSNKIVFIAAAHHAITGGPVCVLDPAIDLDSLEAIARITPQPFPEAEGKLDDWYASPWPLSEDAFLVAYSPYRLRFQGEHQTDPNPDNALGIYLLDAAGNRELLYRDPDIGTTNPTPIAPRRRPPLLPAVEEGERGQTGTMLVSDVYQGLGDLPRGTIRHLRIVQILPKTTWLANNPRMGVAGEENGRAILGTVPVESDGSAYFEVPAGKPILFQALDEHGMAYQTMRSLTFVQPGERTACVGCHEHGMSTPRLDTGSQLALRRPPSAIDPGEMGGRPFGFVEAVQPILDQHCVRCHGGERTEARLDLRGTPHQGFTQSYVSLCGTPGTWTSRHFDPALADQHLVPRFVQRNQIQVTPAGGTYGARGSRLMQLLLDGHEDVRLTPKEIARLATWIDMNAIFYGVYDPVGQSRQLAGQRVPMPEIQ
jgi:hypothetical protein